jgi:hypothetical protein
MRCLKRNYFWGLGDIFKEEHYSRRVMIPHSLLFQFGLFLRGQDIRVRIKIILLRTAKGLLRRWQI